MAIDYKQVKATNIAALTTVYTAPANTKAVVSYAAVGTALGAADTLAAIVLGADTFFRDVPVQSEGRILHELEGVILEAGDTISVNDADGDVSIALGIKELS